MNRITIKVDDLTGNDIAQFLEEHLQDMRSVSPPESKHALDLTALKKPDITFWSIYKEEQLIGCGALKELSLEHGEIKSMRISTSQRGQGIAAQLLTHIIDEGRKRGYQMLSLETGSMDFFIPARRLYKKYGFIECKPFADYVEDKNSLFMNLIL